MMKSGFRQFAVMLLAILIVGQILPVYAEADVLISENTIMIGSEGFVEPLTIENTKDTTLLLVGQTLSLNVPEEYQDGVAWSSSNKDVATVSDRGEVTAVGAGHVTILVRDKANESNNASLTLQVIEPESSHENAVNILVEWASVKGLVYDGEEHTLEYTISCDATFFDPGKVQFLGEIPSRKDCGITIGAVVPEDFRYDDPEVDANFVVKNGSIWISARDVTVTVNDAEKETEQEDPEFTYTVTGLAECDEGRDDLFQLTLTREAGEEPGVYPIRADGEEAQGNYHLQFVEGQLTIGQPLITELNVRLESSAGLIIWEGDTVVLTAVIEDRDENAQYVFEWEVDRGEGWEVISRGTEDSYSYTATAENMGWDWRVTVYLD